MKQKFQLNDIVQVSNQYLKCNNELGYISYIGKYDSTVTLFRNKREYPLSYYKVKHFCFHDPSIKTLQDIQDKYPELLI